jgi:streptogrisin C
VTLSPRRLSTTQRVAVLIAVIAIAMPWAPVSAGEESGGEADSLRNPVLQDLPDVPAPQIADPISEAELTDLKSYARQEGLSLEFVIERYGWADNFALAVDKLREEHPDAFSGAAIVDARTAWIGFVADPPQAAVQVMETFKQAHAPVSVEVRSKVGYSEVEVRDAVATVHFAALEATGDREVDTAFDSETGQITSRVPSGSAKAFGLEKLQTAAVDSLRGSGLGRILERISVNVVGSELPTLGGTNAHIGGEGWTTCTSGFTVQHWDGRTGIATAGHCPDSQKDDGHVLTLRLQHEGQFGDMQWHTGPEDEPDDFFAGSSTQLEVDRRDVAAWGNPVVGQLLCKNGKSGFKDCDNVRALWTCYWIYCSLHRMQHHYGVDGDSGGPWFYSNTAYGIHHGWVWEPWESRSLFSSVGMLPQVLDVSVRK